MENPLVFSPAMKEELTQALHDDPAAKIKITAMMMMKFRAGFINEMSTDDLDRITDDIQSRHRRRFGLA